MSKLEDLSERYGEHHRERRTREFVYAGEERAALFRDYVGGPNRRVLDLGCRYGALTRTYARDRRFASADRSNRTGDSRTTNGHSANAEL